MTNGQPQRRPSGAQSGGAVYGLGLLGAMVWCWRRANGVGGHLAGVLKALVWPAFLVYDAFRAFNRGSEGDRSRLTGEPPRMV